jgi:uncharacterized protein (TIGR02117 family)
VSRILRIAVWAAVLTAGSIVLYTIAALAFALLPVKGQPQRPSQDDPAVYVCASLAHADIVLPLNDPLVDWRLYFGKFIQSDLPSHLYLAFGWGDLVFFRETPTWGDVRLSTASMALLGQHETALRVVVVDPPANDPECRRVQIEGKGRRKLIDHVLATLQLDSFGVPKEQKSASRFEVYYIAKGSYGPFHTCNQWVADGLGKADLPHAVFAPFSFSVMWPLDGV